MSEWSPPPTPDVPEFVTAGALISVQYDATQARGEKAVLGRVDTVDRDLSDDPDVDAFRIVITEETPTGERAYDPDVRQVRITGQGGGGKLYTLRPSGITALGGLCHIYYWGTGGASLADRTDHETLGILQHGARRLHGDDAMFYDCTSGPYGMEVPRDE